MLGTQTQLLTTAVETVNTWRTAAESAGIDLQQINLQFPDGRPVVLKWLPEAVDNGDGTFTGSWLIDT